LESRPVGKMDTLPRPQVDRQLAPFAGQGVEGIVADDEVRKSLIDEVSLVDESVALCHDRLDSRADQRPNRLLARAARAPTFAGDDDVLTVLRSLRELGPHVVESVLAQLLELGQVAEFARDYRIGVDVISEALHAAGNGSPA